MIALTFFTGICCICAGPRAEADQLTNEIEYQQKEVQKDRGEWNFLLRDCESLWRIQVGPLLGKLGRAPTEAEIPPAARIRQQESSASDRLCGARSALIANLTLVQKLQRWLKAREASAGRQPGPNGERMKSPISDRPVRILAPGASLREKIEAETARLERDEADCDRARRELMKSMRSEFPVESLNDKGREAQDRRSSAAYSEVELLDISLQVCAARARLIVAMKDVDCWRRRMTELDKAYRATQAKGL
jgi:hypothetical protein